MTGLQIMNEVNVIQEWRLYIVQEFCDGGSLRQAIEARSFLNPATRMPQMEWVLQVRTPSRDGGRSPAWSSPAASADPLASLAACLCS